MERSRNIVKFFLVTKDYIFRWYTHWQLHFQSLLLLFFSFKYKHFAVSHKPSRARLLKYVIDGAKFHISHLDNNLELFLL